MKHLQTILVAAIAAACCGLFSGRSAAAEPAYVLSADELALDCKKLTGRMQVRIRQLRSESADPATSELSRGLQAATKPIFGGSERGIDPAAAMSRDRIMLEAYNARLKQKGCPVFDLGAALAGGQPRPVKPAKPPAGKEPSAKAPVPAAPTSGVQRTAPPAQPAAAGTATR